MDLHDLYLTNKQEEIVKRYIAACQADHRIIAAFLGGSYATGMVDEYADLDLFFITTDEAYDEFILERENFIRQLGKPLFIEDFGLSHGYCIIYSNAVECDIWFGHESQYKNIYSGPYRILLDKKGLLIGQIFPPHTANRESQIELLRQQLDWFWHELSHFIKAMRRRQLWFAYGQLEALRQICVTLARLEHNFSDPYLGDEPYFKIEHALPHETLAPLKTTYCPMAHEPMVQAVFVLFHYYKTAATSLAGAHNLAYQAELERMMISHLEELNPE